MARSNRSNSWDIIKLVFILILVGIAVGLGLIRNRTNRILEASTTYSPKVLLLIYNPILETQGNQKLTTYKGWNDPASLSQTLVNTFSTASSGKVNYQIVETIELDAIPVKTDGFQYTDDTYLTCVNSGGSQCHSPDGANYLSLIAAADACPKRNAGQIDELWIWGGPWFGFWESNLAGPNAFWYNSNPTSGSTCTKLLPIMGFNYERGQPEALESFGHRLESTMRYVYGSWSAQDTHNWNKFTLLDVDLPGKGGCGNAHLAVNAETNTGYNTTSTRVVPSRCEDFLNYPNLTNTFVDTSCSTWNCNNLDYFKWWYSHLPKFDGIGLDGKYSNWWTYVVDPQTTIIDPGTFSNLFADLGETTATFNFGYTGASSTYKVDMSTTSDMSWDVYLDFASGPTPPLTVTNPQSRWDKYRCDTTLYWRVWNAARSASSPIQSGVLCAPPSPSPSPTPSPTPSPSPSLSPSPSPKKPIKSPPSPSNRPKNRSSSKLNPSTMAADLTATFKTFWLAIKAVTID